MAWALLEVLIPAAERGEHLLTIQRTAGGVVHTLLTAASFILVDGLRTSHKELITLHIRTVHVGIGWLTRKVTDGDGLSILRIDRHRKAIIKDETLALVMSPTLFFGIGEDTTMKLVYIIIAFFLHEHRELLTADASGAIHKDFGILGDVRIIDPLWEIIKIFEIRKDGSFKMANATLIIIADIDEHIGLIRFQGLAPLFRTKVTSSFSWIKRHIGFESYDFGTDFDDESSKRNTIALVFFELRILKPRLGPESFFVSLCRFQ